MKAARVMLRPSIKSARSPFPTISDFKRPWYLLDCSVSSASCQQACACALGFLRSSKTTSATSSAHSVCVCRYPNKQQQELFFRHYLAQEQQQVAAATAAAAGASADSAAAAAAEADPPPVDPEVLDRLSAEANAWALASHLYWGVWAIIQACNSPIDFDYMQFSATRLGEFRRKKDEFLSEARRVFGGTGDAAVAAADV
jgi:hypothetical protein